MMVLDEPKAKGRSGGSPGISQSRRPPAEGTAGGATESRGQDCQAGVGTTGKTQPLPGMQKPEEYPGFSLHSIFHLPLVRPNGNQVPGSLRNVVSSEYTSLQSRAGRRQGGYLTAIRQMSGIRSTGQSPQPHARWMVMREGTLTAPSRMGGSWEGVWVRRSLHSLPGDGTGVDAPTKVLHVSPLKDKGPGA